MDDVLDELQDSPTPEDAETSEEEQPEEEKTVPYKDFKQVYARAKDAEKELKQLKGKQGKTSEEDLEEILNIRMDGHSRDEVEYMKAVAKHQGKKLTEVVNDPFIRAGVEGLRSKNKSQSATPSPSSRPNMSSSSKGKTFAEMSEDERKTNFDKVRSKFSGGGRRSNE